MINRMQEKGVALFLAVLIISVILAIGLGISGIIIQQIKISENIGDSVVSFYAADSGIEQQIYDLYNLETHSPVYEVDMINSASYNVSVKCSVSNDACLPGGEFDNIPIVIDPESPEYCDAMNFCIKSIGTFQAAKRAIEVKY
ncbi:MAG: hypothetical protein A2Z78_01375 [Candidatus Nealsonbacteria bacterium RBG_13_36_15]|uniref:Type 4 fimbrial biogenesis protein PilX N-terminal domain-containing protein n=1 Tax=Candidatus Nealsonbacteria bacterium RBG_13_36_15 TaxID=1801660 RepID=A0A1G2DX18_9BACT|nr:MAG: hypothetical protein A2Z78_01375 [Candidatus Nealsonbacteria bacterium RBG_13_36_15]